MLYISFAILVALCMYVFYLSSRIDTLEKIMRELGSKEAQPKPLPSPISATATTTPPPAPTEIKVSVFDHGKTPTYLDISYWISGPGLLRIGAVLVLLGATWFVSYAFAQNWIGPMARIVLGVGAGAILMVFGEALHTKRPDHSTIVMSLGATVVILSLYAARVAYDFFTPISASLMMLAALAGMSLSSVHHRDELRSLLAVVGVALIPFLQGSGEKSPLLLATYVLTVSLGLAGVFVKTGWERVGLALSGVYALHSVMLLAFGNPQFSSTLLIFILILCTTLIHFGVHFVQLLKSSEPNHYYGFGATMLTTLASLLWARELLSDPWQGLAAIGLALGLCMAAYVAHLKSNNKELVFVYALLSLVSLAAAVSFALSGWQASVLYLVLAVMAVFVSEYTLMDVKAGLSMGLFPYALGIYHLGTLMRETNQLHRAMRLDEVPLDIQPLILTLMATVSVLILGVRWFMRLQTTSSESLNYTKYYLIAGSYLALVVLWYALDFIAPSNKDLTHAVSLISYTILGLVGYFGGLHFGHKKLRLASSVVLVAVVARLLLFEVWTMATIERVFVFVLIGALFMATSLYHKPIMRKEDNEEAI
jgi:uncharacterized membrane protein